jgi:hypothetical protein
MADFREIAETLSYEEFNIIPLNNDKSPAGWLAGTEYLYKPITVFDDRYICDKIGVTCGVASKGLEVIDFDKHQGQDIDSVFIEFMKDPEVINLIANGFASVYKTPSGGYHFMFLSGRYFGATETLARYADNNVMIEIRSGGAYVVCYPSEGYSFITGVEMVKLEEIEKDSRAYLISLAKSFDLGAMKAKQGKGPGNGTWGNFDTNKTWGKFNEEGEAEVKILLKQKGWTYVSTRKKDGVELWRRPDKVKGISATFGQYKNMFYCFTDAKSAEPFELDRGYTPTDILMLLKFDGDWQKTKQYLSDKYKVVVEPEQELKLNVIKFPIDVFPESIQNYIVELNRTLNYKKDFLAVSFMFTMATINGNCFKLRVKNGWISATTFWFAVVGESGVMKTHPITQMVRPLKEIDRMSKTGYDLEMEQYNTLDDNQKKKEPKPVFRQLLIEDFTIEACHYIHKNNPRGLGLHKDELVGFLNDMNKYRKGSDEQFWLESFNNSSYIVNRVTKEPLMINDIMVNIIGGIQPNILHQIANSANGNGLIERFLYTTSESNIFPLSIDDIQKEWIDWYSSTIKHIEPMFTYSDRAQIIEMDIEALKLMIEFDTKVCKIQESEDETSGMRNYLNKIKTYLPRFALLVCIIDTCFDGGSYQVTLNHMQKATKIADYFISSARFIFQESERVSEISTVKQSLKQKGLSKTEQIIEMYKKGYKQIDIAKTLSTPASYVSKILSKL